MTSNLGAEILAHDQGEVVSEKAKTEVFELVEHYYPPEFLNRYHISSESVNRQYRLADCVQQTFEGHIEIYPRLTLERSPSSTR